MYTVTLVLRVLTLPKHFGNYYKHSWLCIWAISTDYLKLTQCVIYGHQAVTRELPKVITHAFTLTLWFASSIARAFVKDVIPPYHRKRYSFIRIKQLSLLFIRASPNVHVCMTSPRWRVTLVATYVTAPGCPIWATRLVSLMMFPSVFLKWGNAYWIIRTTCRFTFVFHLTHNFTHNDIWQIHYLCKDLSGTKHKQKITPSRWNKTRPCTHTNSISNQTRYHNYAKDTSPSR